MQHAKTIPEKRRFAAKLHKQQILFNKCSYRQPQMTNHIAKSFMPNLPTYSLTRLTDADL